MFGGLISGLLGGIGNIFGGGSSNNNPPPPVYIPPPVVNEKNEYLIPMIMGGVGLVLIVVLFASKK